MQKGFLISFEGGEGVGKTTQLELLAKHFLEKNIPTVVLREPGGTHISEQIRAVVLNGNNTEMAFTTEVLLFQAARAQIYAEVILPSLQSGKIVLCDRTRDSSVVYQGIVRGFGIDKIESLNALSTQNTFPDLTILLDTPVEVGLKRRSQTGKMNRLDMEQQDFHKKVRQGYLELAKKNDRGRWVVIDASMSVKEVYKEILILLNQKKFLIL